MATNKPEQKKTAAKKQPAKKTQAKKTPAKKTAAKKTVAKKATPKKTVQKKTAVKKTAVKKTAPKSKSANKNTKVATGDTGDTALSLAADVFSAFTNPTTSTNPVAGITNIVYANDVKSKTLRDRILKWFKQ